ncbi:hypothetical protein [Chitiniphilus shinanonensis]|uniref:hypothetical protein n=1 Tax=Chitiniphilus shinanonensis TaxID=553088 RepID=UPI0030492224
MALNDAQRAHATAGGTLIALLDCCARLGWLSLAFTLHAGWLLGGGVPLPLWLTMTAVVTLGLGVQYLALRLALDARLFRVLYRDGADAAAFDQALAELFGRPAPEQGARPLADRWRGTRRLVLVFVLLCGAQATIWVITLISRAWA